MIRLQINGRRYEVVIKVPKAAYLYPILYCLDYHNVKDCIIRTLRKRGYSPRVEHVEELGLVIETNKHTIVIRDIIKEEVKKSGGKGYA